MSYTTPLVSCYGYIVLYQSGAMDEKYNDLRKDWYIRRPPACPDIIAKWLTYKTLSWRDVGM